MTKTYTYHLHLVSDATGETLNAIAKAACAQYDQSKAVEHIYTLVRTRKRLDRVIESIKAKPGIVLHTLMDSELQDHMEQACQQMHTPSLPILSPAVHLLGQYLGVESTHRPGGQHVIDSDYFERIDALNYTVVHDDGQATHDLNRADVILVGVSRTSKTPTCMYLANRGIKAANVPIVPEVPLPSELLEATNPLVVGLTISEAHLLQIRKHRLKSIRENSETDYTNSYTVREELHKAMRLFRQKNWPVIDVTRISIEEIAAEILNLKGS